MDVGECINLKFLKLENVNGINFSSRVLKTLRSFAFVTKLLQSFSPKLKSLKRHKFGCFSFLIFQKVKAKIL